MQADAHAYLTRARDMLAAVTAASITISEFEREFLALNADAPATLDSRDAAALDDVFWAIEAHVEDPDLRGVDEIDDQQLLHVVATSLASLTPSS